MRNFNSQNLSKNDHREIYCQFKVIFEQEGLDKIDERLQILEVFLGLEDHPTSYELTFVLKDKGFDFSEDFVADNLKLFTKFGFANEKEFKDQPPRYEHLHLGTHHDHLICVRCGKILEFYNPEIEAIQTQVANEKGFHNLQHRMEIYGLCSNCFQKREPIMPLTMVSEGETVRITALNGGGAMVRRLNEMGFYTGTQVQVINKGKPGPFLVALKGSRLGIGHGVANKIIVKPL
ncbi:MAG: transcriptional repressor [Thermodesulfobacteriota bacterium]|nr:transcriptional repressor [Thermodesulfobacteriota bacterium]